MGKKVGIIGSGAAGLTAAYLHLQRGHSVSLFERESELGGHVLTVDIQDPSGQHLALDTGFMVFNDRTYPNLLRLFDQLGGIQIGKSDMSFGYYNAQSGVQYAINFDPTSPYSKSINLSDTLPPDQMNVYRRLLAGFVAFSKQAVFDLDSNQMSGLTLRDYLKDHPVSDQVIDSYLIPMASAIWSTSVSDIFDFPAENLFKFFKNHGLITLGDRLNWYYVVGGAKTYVHAIRTRLIQSENSHVIHDPAVRVTRNKDHVLIQSKSGITHRVDEVIFATHADEVLPLLDAPTPTEVSLFSKWRYQPNVAVLHRDLSVMPPNRAAWASWNYAVESIRGAQSPLSVTYHLNRLQDHQTDTQYFLSLNRQTPINPDSILRTLSFTHPVYSGAAIDTQPKIQAINGQNRTYFCGSYLGNGFHEDAVKSAVDAVGGW